MPPEDTSTALDLYQALCGNHAWPLFWFKRVSSVSLGDLWRQTVDNLRRDGTLWQWRTWRSAARHLLGRNGLLRETWRPWRANLEAGFHPGQNDSALSAGWLRANAAQCTLVGRN